MSIRLTQLIGLSYDLAQGRKRRSEWEAFAEKATSVDGDEDSLTGGYCCSHESSGDSSDSSDDAAEMQFLHASLRAQGLPPRAPDAEHAFLRLMCADRRAKAQKLQGTDFDWMLMSDVVEPAGKLEILCPPKADKKGADSDSTFARLLADTFSADTVDPFAPPSELLADAHGPDQLPHTEDLHEHGASNTRLPVALARLSALLSCDSASSSSSDDTSTESADEEFYDHDDSLSEEDAIFCEEVSREVLIEAEREELVRMLAQEVAEEVEKISISGN